jgi:hypothetical protein
MLLIPIRGPRRARPPYLPHDYHRPPTCRRHPSLRRAARWLALLERQPQTLDACTGDSLTAWASYLCSYEPGVPRKGSERNLLIWVGKPCQPGFLQVLGYTVVIHSSLLHSASERVPSSCARAHQPGKRRAHWGAACRWSAPPPSWRTLFLVQRRRARQSLGPEARRFAKVGGARNGPTRASYPAGAHPVGGAPPKPGRRYWQRRQRRGRPAGRGRPVEGRHAGLRGGLCGRRARAPSLSSSNRQPACFRLRPLADRERNWAAQRRRSLWRAAVACSRSARLLRAPAAQPRRVTGRKRRAPLLRSPLRAAATATG